MRLQRGHGLVHAGQCMLDVGTGTGTIARYLPSFSLCFFFSTSHDRLCRQLAGHGCQVTALDPSLEMINAAKQLSQQEDVEISFVHSKIGNSLLLFSSFYEKVVTESL